MANEDENKEGGQENDSGSQKNLERPTAEEIYEQVARDARIELERPSIALAISGLTCGLCMGLSALGVGMAQARLGKSPGMEMLSAMFYPVGFIVVILGRAQLFTENTLYPVALVLAERRELWNTLRLWSIVLPSNVLGAIGFAVLAAKTRAIAPETVQAVSELGVHTAHLAAGQLFWSAVMAGWIIATTAWLVTSSHSITGSVMVIWGMTFLVGLGNFAHCIAGSCEVLVAVVSGSLGWMEYPRWLAWAAGGNVVGGVMMVTLLEYGQAVFAKEAK